jgi:hypothetical protein
MPLLPLRPPLALAPCATHSPPIYPPSPIPTIQIYFLVLLLHRDRRDDHACRLKYGKDWDKFCSIVRYRMFPLLYVSTDTCWARALRLFLPACGCLGAVQRQAACCNDAAWLLARSKRDNRVLWVACCSDGSRRHDAPPPSPKRGDPYSVHLTSARSASSNCEGIVVKTTQTSLCPCTVITCCHEPCLVAASLLPLLWNSWS